MKHFESSLTSTFVVLAVLLFLPGGNSAHAELMIDLNDFFFFFGDPVTVAPDGSSAVLAEDSLISPILLSNDPGLGDPEVIFSVYPDIGGIGQILSFDWIFVEPVGTSTNADEFGAFVLDADTGLSAGTDFEFYAQDSSAGTVSFDLSSLAGRTLGLQFQLSALPGDWDLDSTVTISNVRLNPVPVPGAALLACLGMGMVSLIRKAKNS